MNVFLSDKIGSYLSQFNDVSFYKNTITFDAGDGTFSLTHNLFQPTGKDSPIRSFATVGVRANITNSLAAAFSNRPFENEMGLTLKKTWVSLPKQRFTCNQKAALDAERMLQLITIQKGLNAKADDFEKSLDSIWLGNKPEEIGAKKDALRKIFLEELRQEAIRQFSFGQSQLLIKCSAYKSITVHYTSLSLYAPVIRQQFFVAASLTTSLQRKHAYPVTLALSHTRLFDWGLKGRLFLTATATVFQNNTVRGGLLTETPISDYINLGGTDTLRLAEVGRHTIYRGRYRNFFTPSLQVQAIYFPPNSHIGFSGAIEQFFGQYSTCNVVLGFPIVLIDKDTAPAANFQFQLRYMDIGNSVMPARQLKDKISVGMTMGVPFSKIIF